jgi:ankyrin repeat protein
MVAYLLEKGASAVGSTSANGRSAILWGAEGGSLEVVQMLQNAGGDLWARGGQGETAFIIAGRCGSESAALINMLLEGGADVNARTTYGQTALGGAARGGYFPNATVLGDCILACSTISADQKRRAFTDALVYVVANTATESEETINVVNWLIAREADCDGTDRDGKTVLMRCCGTGLCKTAEALCAHGADTQATRNNVTALQDAAEAGHIEIVELLHKHGRGLDQGAGLALVKAASEGHTVIVEFLHRRFHADLKTRNGEGKTALIAACVYGHVSTVKYLLQQRVDTEARQIPSDDDDDNGWLEMVHGTLDGATALMVRPICLTFGSGYACC